MSTSVIYGTIIIVLFIIGVNMVMIGNYLDCIGYKSNKVIKVLIEGGGLILLVIFNIVIIGLGYLAITESPTDIENSCRIMFNIK